MVGQIREVRASLHILQNVPEFRNATARLAQLEKKLELQLRPKFLAALRANDVQSIVELRTVYFDIQQEAVMKMAYFETRQEPLQAFFNSQAQAPIVEWLPQFYNRLLTIVAAEAENCQLLFGRERKVAVQVDLAVYLLDHFARGLAARMEGISLKSAVDLRAVAEVAAQQLDPKAIPILEAPFAVFIGNYGQSEKDVLLGELATRSDADLFALAESAVDRCHSLTKFSQLNGLVAALETLFATGMKVSSSLPSVSSSSATSKTVVVKPHVDQWNAVHSALKGLSTAKAAHRRLCAFDSRLRARILSVAVNESLSADAGRAVLPGAEQMLRGQIEAQRSVVFGNII
jgi:hypothetical protein